MPAAGGREQRVLPIAISDLAISPSHSDILYTNQPSDEQPWRKGAVSDATRDIWQWSPHTGKHTQITTFRGEDRNPVWSADGSSMYYLSEQAAVSTSGSSDLMVQNPYKSPTTKSCPFVS